jgi:hypothetical protein
VVDREKKFTMDLSLLWLMLGARVMEDLMTYYGANRSQANLEKARKILSS